MSTLADATFPTAEPNWPPSAAIVYAAAALHLGLSARRLGRALAEGLSLADVEERRGRSGLEGAVLHARERMGRRGAMTAAAANRVVDVRGDGWNAWRGAVERATDDEA